MPFMEPMTVTNQYYLPEITENLKTHFADDDYKCIALYQTRCSLIQNSLQFVSTGPIENESALVKLMD